MKNIPSFIFLLFSSLCFFFATIHYCSHRLTRKGNALSWQGGARTHDLLINSQALPPTELHANILYKTLNIGFVYYCGYQPIRHFNLPRSVLTVFFLIFVHQIYMLYLLNKCLYFFISFFLLYILYNNFFKKSILFDKNFFLYSTPWLPVVCCLTNEYEVLSPTLLLNSRFLV